jgi:hypothetical protein
MLASSSYTHNNPLSRPHSSTSSSSFQPTKRVRLSSSATPSPAERTAKTNSYFQTSATSGATTPVVVTSDVPIDNIDLYMPNSYEFPSSQNSSYTYGLVDAHDLSMWAVGGGNTAGVANPTSNTLRQAQNHNRQPSTSSIGSTVSAASSPYQLHQATQGVRGSAQVRKSSSNVSHQRNQSSTGGHLPTPTQTPTRNTFLTQHPSIYSQHQDLNSAAQASLLMNSVLLDQKYGDEEVPQMSHSNRPSFSSMGQAPATPMTAVGDRHDDGQQIMNNGENYSSDLLNWLSQDLPSSKVDSMTGTIIPKFNRTVTDAYVDNLYFAQPAVSQQPSNPSYLMPANTMVNDRLLEAQMARSQSSGSNQSAPMSPFRYGHTDNEQREMKYQLSPQDSSPKTISPKDAVLDYNAATSDYPLFPQSTADMSNTYAAVAPVQRREQHYGDGSAMNFGNNNNNAQVWGSNMQAFTAAPMQSFTSFATPALPSNMNIPNMSGFIGNSMAQPTRNPRRQTERTPEFLPAQLTRMESSASEAPQSSQNSSAQAVTSPKPESSADSGTYSCTYHGCLQRFTTPQKLQKHKRDSHRNSPHVTPGVGSGMSTAQLMERNSQTGPHICGRTNPTTGKPCDAVFSRPYDLTRHEDTIHNIRKQKVRCAICIEEKTFSRSDALTRHMRVVHPEVDFPGKHRKRGSRDE